MGINTSTCVQVSYGDHNNGALCCSGGVDASRGPSLAVDSPLHLLQYRDHVHGPGGLAQPHLDQTAPRRGPAFSHLSAPFLVSLSTLPRPRTLGFRVNPSVLVCLLSVIPESPCWLLLMKKKDILERYRDNSPEDKHLLDLVTCLSSFEYSKKK